MAACGLAGAVDKVAAKYGVPAVFTSDKNFGKEGKYSYNSYMHGRQYYYGLSLGAAYKFSDNFSAFAGVRGVYASTNYYGYVEDIKVGNMPLYKVLDPTKETAANIELSCDQSGVGFTPIIGVDFKTGKWNFAAKYELKTRIRLKNKSVNQVPSIGNLPDNLRNAYIAGGVPAVSYTHLVHVIGTEIDFIGTAEDIDETGALLVRDESGVLQRVLSGDVSVRGVMGYV